MDHQSKQLENLVIEKDLAQYQVDKQNEDIKAEKKRKKILDMMLNNIKTQNEQNMKKKAFEREQDTLQNTKDIMLMGEFEKLRVKEVKIKKGKDDLQNRVRETEKCAKRVEDRKHERETANELPFYERLRVRDDELETKLRQDELAQKKILQHKAAYINGKCILNASKIDQQAKIDEKRADIQAQEMREKYDREVQAR